MSQGVHIIQASKRSVGRTLDRLASLKSTRSVHEGHWRELARYCHPSRQIGVSANSGSVGIGVGGGGGLARESQTQLFDSTAALAADTLASGLFALLTNPAVDWFELKGSSDDAQTKALGQALSHALEDRRNGLYGVLPDFYRDLVAFGTAILGVEAEQGGARGHLRFAVRALDEMCFAANEAGAIDTAFREFTLTAEQCLARYGTSAPEAASKAVERGDPDQRISLVHLVQPRADHDPAAVGTRGLAFESLVLDPTGQREVHAGGYHEFPYLVARWSLASGGGDVYGESPASLALADIRALNAMVRTNLTAAQKAVDPPLMAVDDNGLRGAKTHPGAIVFGGLDLNGKRMLEPLPMGGAGAVNLGLALEEQRRDSIREAFHLGLLREASQQPATQTATEFLGKQEERLRLLAPNLGRVEAELLYPLVRRVAAILNRAGVAPPWPEGQDVRFLSPLAQAQRAAEAHRLTRSIKALQPFAEAVPDVMQQLDTEALTRELLDFAGLPKRQEAGL